MTDPSYALRIDRRFVLCLALHSDLGLTPECETKDEEREKVQEGQNFSHRERPRTEFGSGQNSYQSEFVVSVTLITDTLAAQSASC